MLPEKYKYSGSVLVRLDHLREPLEIISSFISKEYEAIDEIDASRQVLAHIREEYGKFYPDTAEFIIVRENVRKVKKKKRGA